MSDRFHTPDLSTATAGVIVTLAGTEAHHLLHVLRAKVGLGVELFDGCGHVAAAEVCRVSKRDLDLTLQSVTTVPESLLHIELAVAAPKGDRLRWLVEKATEVGVNQLTLIDTARGQVTPAGSKLNKLEQTMLAACKQSRRAWQMPLRSGVSWQSILQHAATFDARVLAHPGSRSVGELIRELQNTSPNRLLILVGPEGGFTDDEVAVATAADITPVSLGAEILRIETAAVTLAAALRWAV